MSIEESVYEGLARRVEKLQAEIVTKDTELDALKADIDRALKAIAEYDTENESLKARIKELEKNDARYRWLCEKGPSYHGAMIGSGSMSISRGPYIYLERPANNRFSNVILNKEMADAFIDVAMGEKA